MPSHRILAARFAVFAVGLTGVTCAALAQPSAADAAAAQAQSALSARYAQLWQTLDAAGRARLSASERHWLAVTRWQEQRRCVEQREAQTSAAANETDSQREDLESGCLAAVTLRRVQALASTAVAAR